MIARDKDGTRCRVWDNAGESVIVVRALYGLKIADASFWAHLAKCIQELGYWSCDADPDL